jgi:hypothetical protein
MKKYLFMLLAMLPIMMLTACSSDDDDNSSVSLKGTTWISPDDGDGERVIKFTEKEFYFTITYQGETDSDNGTYTYTPPFVNLTAINQDTNKLETESGKIDGNKLTFGDIVYTKK